MIEITSKEQLDNIKGVCLLHIYGTTCGPCKITAPIIETFSKFQSTSNVALTVVKVNAEEHPNITQSFCVRSLPSLVITIDGIFEKSKTGTFSGKELMSFMSGYLAG